jgi:hypothetical protein
MNMKQMIDEAHGPQKDEQDILIENALKKYPEAKRIAVENFVMTALVDAKYDNRYNLIDDTINYGWNADTFAAIRECLEAEEKI